MLTFAEWRLVVWWMLACGIGWTMGGAIGGTVSTLEYDDAVVGTVLSWLLSNFMMMVISGAIQGLLLRPYVSEAYWWPLAVALGYIAGCMMIAVLSTIITWSMSSDVNQTIIINSNQVFAMATFLGWALVIALVAWAQWLVLQRFRPHHRHHMERWFIPTFAGWAAGLAVLVYISQGLNELIRLVLQQATVESMSNGLGISPVNVLNSVVAFAPAGLVYGCITGIAIALLLRQPVHQVIPVL